jgi:hypothetical protein
MALSDTGDTLIVSAFLLRQEEKCVYVFRRNLNTSASQVSYSLVAELDAGPVDSSMGLNSSTWEVESFGGNVVTNANGMCLLLLLASV